MLLVVVEGVAAVVGVGGPCDTGAAGASSLGVEERAGAGPGATGAGVRVVRLRHRLRVLLARLSSSVVSTTLTSRRERLLCIH